MLRQQGMTFQRAPLLFRCLRQLKGHRQQTARDTQPRVLPVHNLTVAKGGFNRVSGSDVLPVLWGKIIKTSIRWFGLSADTHGSFINYSNPKWSPDGTKI